ncbi:MAG: winged helix-turn-helix transcriptional regulator [Chloroflexi bacterium]|nr:winged helix-turn-helix transcriptional regulator [Chloroflexota bacterium]
MSSDVTLPPEYQTWFLLHEVDTGIQRSMESELKPFGVSVIATGLLYILKSSDEPVTLTELSGWLFRKPHSVSELISRMAKQGLVTKTADPQKKKGVRVSITPKGDQILSEYMEEMQVISKIMSSLSEEETKYFKACLEKIRKSVIEELVLSAQRPFPWGFFPAE